MKIIAKEFINKRSIFQGFKLLKISRTGIFKTSLGSSHWELFSDPATLSTLFLYPLKTSENYVCSDIFRVYKMWKLDIDGLFHFKPVLYSWKARWLVCNSKVFKKQMWNSDNFSKDADRDLLIYLKCLSSIQVFQAFCK